MRKQPRPNIPKNILVSLIPLTSLKDGKVYRGVIDYQDPNGFILTLLYFNADVFKKKIRYEGIVYTAIF